MEKRQEVACQMVSALVEKGIKIQELYANNFNGFDYKELKNIKLCFRRIVGVKASVVASYFPDNWATLIAYYCSRA